jgi:hypothetical protein
VSGSLQCPVGLAKFDDDGEHFLGPLKKNANTVYMRRFGRRLHNKATQYLRTDKVWLIMSALSHCSLCA